MKILVVLAQSKKKGSLPSYRATKGWKKVPLDTMTPNQTILISEDLIEVEEERLMSCLNHNKDVFALSALDLTSVSRTIIEHSLAPTLSCALRNKSYEKCTMINWSGKGRNPPPIGRKVHWANWLPHLACQSHNGLEEKWKVQNVHRFYQSQQSLPKRQFPPTKIDKIVDSAAGCEVMSLLDCFSGYHQIYMKEEDKAKTSFITPFVTYCFVRMPEDLKNAGSTFSRPTKSILENQMGRNIFTYVDDIVIASKNKEDHLSDLAEIFSNMREARLCLNPEKCIFGVRHGKILGYLVSHIGIEVNPGKTHAIMDMAPRSQPEMSKD
jgi:hypothetical protein